MASLNKVYLVGNLTRDPEIRYLPSGQPVGELRMAVNRKFRGANGEERDETCFVSVVVWGKQAETSNKYLAKGSPLLVEGRLQYEEWEKDGKKQNRLRVVAERVQFLGTPRRGAEFGAPAGEAGGGHPPPPVRSEPAPDQAGPAPGDDLQAGGGDVDNLPF